MRNDYALCTAVGLDAITAHIESLTADEYEALCGKLCIGLLTGAHLDRSRAGCESRARG